MGKGKEEREERGVRSGSYVYCNYLVVMAGELQLIDTHCHARDDPANAHLLSDLRTHKLFLMGTCPKDWLILKNVLLRPHHILSRL